MPQDSAQRLKTTRQAAAELGVADNRLYSLIRCRAVPEPPRDVGGRLVWDGASIEAARVAIEAGRQPNKSKAKLTALLAEIRAERQAIADLEAEIAEGELVAG